MKKKIERLIALIYLLKRHRGLRALEISRRMGVTERTVYRDIASLNEGLCDYVRIICTEAGYLLDPTIYAPPLHLIPEELEALQTAVVALQESHPHYQLAHQALSKLESQTGTFLDLSDLENRLAVMQTIAKDKVSLKRLQELERCLQLKQVLAIEYFSHHSGVVKTIHLEPYSLLFRKQAWYLLGRARDRDKILLLRAYRIRGIGTLPDSFELPLDFTVKDYFKQHWEVFDGVPEAILLHFSGQAALLIEEMLWHPSQQLTQLANGCVELRLNVPANPEFVTWILGWGAECQVIEPAGLRAKIMARIHQLKLAYGALAPELPASISSVGR